MIKGEDSFSFAFELEIPSCLLTNPASGVVTTPKSYVTSKITFTAEQVDCADHNTALSPAVNFEFDTTQFMVKYPKDIVTQNDRVCVKVTATDSTSGVTAGVYKYTAFPEFRTPVVTTNVGNEF